MSVQRAAAGHYVIRDAAGDSVNVLPVTDDDPNGYVILLDVPAFPGIVGLTFDDGLALLQALADMLKVERYVLGDCTKLHADDVEQGAGS